MHSSRLGFWGSNSYPKQRKAIQLTKEALRTLQTELRRSFQVTPDQPAATIKHQSIQAWIESVPSFSLVEEIQVRFPIELAILKKAQHFDLAEISEEYYPKVMELLMQLDKNIKSFALRTMILKGDYSLCEMLFFSYRDHDKEAIYTEEMILEQKKQLEAIIDSLEQLLKTPAVKDFFKGIGKTSITNLVNLLASQSIGEEEIRDTKFVKPFIDLCMSWHENLQSCALRRVVLQGYYTLDSMLNCSKEERDSVEQWAALYPQSTENNYSSISA